MWIKVFVYAISYSWRHTVWTFCWNYLFFMCFFFSSSSQVWRSRTVSTLHCVTLEFSFSWCGWRRGSMVRTSVFNWRTFPDLCLIYGWHVTTSWVRCPLWINHPDQSAFHSFGVGKWVIIHVITWIAEVETIKRQAGTVLVVVWLWG